MRRRLPTTIEYFVMIERDGTEVNFGPYSNSRWACGAAERIPKEGESAKIQKVKCSYLNGKATIVSCETLGKDGI